jgi:hypothetical protein
MASSVVYYDIRGKDTQILTLCKIVYDDKFILIPDNIVESEEVEITDIAEVEKYLADYVDENTSHIYTENKDLNITGREESLCKVFGIEDGNLFRAYRTRYQGYDGLHTRLQIIVELLKASLSVILKAGGLMLYLTRSTDTYNLTACWFTVAIGNYCRKRGVYAEEIVKDEYIYERLELFKLRLSAAVLASGMNVETLQGYTLSDMDIRLLNDIFDGSGAEQPEYMQVQSIEKDLYRLAGINEEFPLYYLLRWYQTELGRKSVKTAEDLVDMLEVAGKRLKIALDDEGMRFETDRCRKDFNKDMSEKLSKKNTDYCLIIDCEGTPERSCREFGAVIFCKVGRALVNVKTYHCMEDELISTLDEIYKDYVNLIGRYIPPQGITTYVYGVNDKQFILNSLGGRKNKSHRKNFENKCNFVDCQSAVRGYLRSNGLEDNGLKLHEVAE